MKLAKILNIKGALLDKEQLESYLEKIASDHILQENSNPDTFPIPRLQENFKFITKTYEILNEHLKMGINIHPAGEWLLDNYYIIEETVKTIQKELTIKKYKNLIGISNGAYAGFARIYVLATEIVAYTEARINAQTLEELLKAYQNKKTLNMEEIWSISTFLQISIIELVRQTCEKIYSVQIQKYKVEDIIERLVEYKNTSNQRYGKKSPYKSKIIESGQIKYPFIEYMSYRLKKYGKKAYSYLEILEEQVMKMGTTVSDVIKKEHFDIAVRKVLIGNCIKSIKEIGRINFLEIFENINGVEELLKQDPIGVYEKMDYQTKSYYRNKIKEIAKRTKISELYITKKALELAKRETSTKEEKKAHIGYYLISDGIKELYKTLQTNKKPKKTTSSVGIYITSIVVLSTIISALLSWYIYIQTNILFGIITFILIYIPCSQIVTQMLQFILGKFIKPTLIPKMDYLNGIPEKEATMVIIPTIVKNPKKVKDLISKLEVFYLANKSENLYFTLLADTSASSKEKEEYDSQIIEIGEQEIQNLNKKYPSNNINKFQFVYRKRVWNKSEKCYLGWERKRGLINQFNEYLLGNIKNPFLANTMEKEDDIPNIKYIITLDSDTNLVLNSAQELVGAASHILNKPELNNKKDAVINGHALIQPRVGVDLEIARKSIFTKIFAGAGGTDPYANAISDTYQDNFSEGIFTGKGIYDLRVFSEVLKEEIPENTVLSHDLLEGSYLRCGLATDILLMDGYPYKYNAFISRLSRWIRGDWQIIRWIMPKIKTKSGVKNNPLNTLSKFKILDNLRRSLVEIQVILSIMVLLTFKITLGINISPLLSIMLISIIFPSVLELFNYICNKKYDQSSNKYFVKTISVVKGSVLRGILNIAFLPHKAYISIDAIIRTIYRMVVTKQNLLQWTTSEEAEETGKTTVLSYLKLMIVNIIIGILGLVILPSLKLSIGSIILYGIFVLWIVSPIIAYYISKEDIPIAKVKELTDEEISYVVEVGKKTWDFFETYINKENNFLPPDNYQEDRNKKIVNRTSSTNIGLGLISIISAYDLGYINIERTISMLDNMLQTIEKLSKWNGHLYNWYNIETLEPLIPKYVSTVDSGNFVGYLYIVKEFLKHLMLNNNEENINKDTIKLLIEIVTNLIQKTDFTTLYDYEKRLFSIGFNVEENKLTDSYYDLLASEARQASLIAIAKHDIPTKHWQNLSRTLTVMNGYKGLVSWSGTAFEYLMPNVNIKKYEGSLLDESCKFMLMSQMEYAKKLGIPWGISESAFNLKDLNSNYQYKAFGIPWLGLKRGLGDEMVVSSYGSILAITDMPKEVVKNIKELEKEGMYGKYGFYEAIDYTPGRLRSNQKYGLVKTYMAHHQGLILLSINNLINNNILQERFMENPEIKAVDILLQERMPEDVIITKEKKEKIEKPKNIDYENYSVRTFNKLNHNLNNYNVISNDNYTICINERGEGFSKYKNILVNRYKQTNDYPEGIAFYIKNIRTKKVWSSIYSNNMQDADKYEVSFMPDMDKFVRSDENITTTVKITTASDDPVEIRSIELLNTGTIEETLEVSSVFEPVLSTKEQDYSHMAFNNLFLKYEYLEDTNTILVKRNKRGDTNPIYLGANLYTQNETIGDLEYEIDEEKLNGGTHEIPKMIKNSIPFSRSLGLTVAPVIALKRTIKIKPGEKVTLNLVLTVSEEKSKIEDNISKYINSENIKRTFELSKVRVEEEARYLGIKGSDIEIYQKMISYLIVQNPMKKLYLKNIEKIYKVQDLWKYGISGNLPILLVKIKDVNDAYVIKEILKAYEFFKVKNIDIDLVILNEEENVYERYVKEAIETEILNRHLMHLLGKNGGIFLLNENEIEDKDLLEFRANLNIDAHSGNMKTLIKELEEEYLDTIKNKNIKQKKYKQEKPYERRNNLINIEELKYYNEYGAFSEDGKEYIIKMSKDKRPPVIWSHVLANPNFGTVITNNNSGYTWYKNSRINRISRWNNNQSLDTPSEIIYLKDEDYGTIWSLSPNINQDDEEYYMTYGFGYARFTNIRMGLLQEQETYIPINDNIKVNIIRLKNTTPEKKELKLFYYIKPVLGEDEIKTDGYININYDENSNIIYANNLYLQDLEESKCYISSSEKIKSYTGSKEEFIGEGTLKSPHGVKCGKLQNENALGNSSCIAIEANIELKAFENKTIVVVLGADEGKTQEVAYKYTAPEKAELELENTKKYWNELLRKIQVKTPVESMNIMLNGWLSYQTIASRLWARSGFYQSGGAYGFRDQLQDTMGIKYIAPNFMKEQILKHASHQFIEGDVEHWWHTETKRGIRTRFSDDLLWLPYVTSEYVRFTEDYSILDERVAYVNGEKLKDGQDEIYDIHLPSEYEEEIYKHCIRAIDRGINLGEHGIPKIGSGDWNDGFSTVGNKGKGESIWLGFFIYEVLNRFIPICELKNDIQKVEEYKKIQNDIKRAINQDGWDGRWFRRAFTDEGDILGSIENEECKIDSIAQSWSVISGAGDNDKKYISMESLEKYLVDKENGVIKLLDPAFSKSKLEPGYIKAYLPGVRENGGQYTHAAVWAIIAWSMLGFGEKGTEYFKIINPIEHTRTKEAVNRYKVEPYVVAADVYGVGNLLGRGGWTWYTGSSSWLYKAGIEYVLGLKIRKGILRIVPAISSSWKEYSIRYEYKSSVYNIKVKNPNGKCIGVESFIFNGEEIPEKQIKLIDNGKINEIEVIM